MLIDISLPSHADRQRRALATSWVGTGVHKMLDGALLSFRLGNRIWSARPGSSIPQMRCYEP